MYDNWLIFVQLLQVLDYRHEEATKQNDLATIDLIGATQRDGELMTLMTRTTIQDSRTMKIMAFITLIYLPGTLVAVS